MRLEFYSDHITIALSRRNLLALLVQAEEPTRQSVLMSRDVWVNADPATGLLVVHASNASTSSVSVRGAEAAVTLSTHLINHALDQLDHQQRVAERLDSAASDPRPVLLLAEDDHTHYAGRRTGPPGPMRHSTEQRIRLLGATPAQPDLN